METNVLPNRVPRLSVVIVTWNARDFLRDCLDFHLLRDLAVGRRFRGLRGRQRLRGRLRGHGRRRISRPSGSSATGRTSVFPRPTTWPSDIILQEKRSGLITLVNSDMVIKERAIEKMAAFLSENPDIAAVGPAFLLPDGRFQVGTGGYLPTTRTMFNYFFVLFKIFPRRTKGFYIEQAAFAEKDGFLPVEWLSGGCLTIRRATRRAHRPDGRRIFFLWRRLVLGPADEA